MLYPFVSIFRLNCFVQFYVLFAILFLSSQRYAVAQFNDLGVHGLWFEGKIILSDLTPLKGYVQYNDKLGLIKFKTSEGEEEHSFTEKRIIQMEFFDTKQSAYREFANFNFKEVETEWEGTLLFEIIIEFKEFAVLSRRYPVYPAMRSMSIYTNKADQSSSNINIGYDYTEQICVARSDGIAEVVLQITDTEVRSNALVHPYLKPVLSKDVMMRNMGAKWKQVDEFVKANKLKLTKREDLMRAFAHYEELLLKEG